MSGTSWEVAHRLSGSPTPRASTDRIATAGAGTEDIIWGSVMSLAYGDGSAGLAMVAEPEPVALVRYRQGVVGETARTVHVVTRSAVVRDGVVSALCGVMLTLEHLEDVAVGEGMPCIACVLHSVTDAAAAETPSADTAGPSPDGVSYQQWGWPVTQDHGQVRLRLDHTASALMIPVRLADAAIPLLIRRGCAPPALIHPYLPDFHIVLFGERYGLPLPWPGQVHQITGAILLPPTPTPLGPITWISTPCPESLQLCREIDLFIALRSSETASAGELPG